MHSRCDGTVPVMPGARFVDVPSKKATNEGSQNVPLMDCGTWERPAARPVLLRDEV